MPYLNMILLRLRSNFSKSFERNNALCFLDGKTSLKNVHVRGSSYVRDPGSISNDFVLNVPRNNTETPLSGNKINPKRFPGNLSLDLLPGQ
jgi:hypothetical protein